MVAMSGGVDSSVAAALLLDEGFEVCGATLRLFDNGDIGIDNSRTCCSLDDVEDARSVAYKLNIEHFVFNFGLSFKENVIDRFAKGYAMGETPNPCIDCNKYIKFGKLIDRAELLEQDYIATGHYVRREVDPATGRFLLRRAVDHTKDQTYVLYNMTQRELAKTLFPLGGFIKNDAREIAQARGLINARKPDSQDICFVKDGDYARFLKDVMKIDVPEGDFVDLKGNFIAKHKGIINYTIGQRKGLGISHSHPLFVIKKDPKTNNVVLGKNEDLFSTRLTAKDVNYISIPELSAPMKVYAKARYRQEAAPATIFPQDDGKVTVEFKAAQRAITPGQAVVFYSDDYVVGGGTIE